MKDQTIDELLDAECPETCVPDPASIERFHAAIDAVVGKWKIEILCTLLDGALRFGDLKRALPGVTQHMLTAQLRDLEANGLLTRTAYGEVPPRVEYALTEASVALLPVFRSLHDWADRYGAALIAKRARPKPQRKNGKKTPEN
ncbi:winged helix-turn-helix transcriptional regulator [Paraburkholderia acidipaludis]|uniref:winged helix-turn-helix transcriptional regulator n=1 Tax=Paraburkholderia acidipaludis TaxID=660537 RepID=UPI0005BE81DB|nr:helix-turn-helix domain-containing protein [Paraburkholderia acidipaludis]